MPLHDFHPTTYVKNTLTVMTIAPDSCPDLRTCSIASIQYTPNGSSTPVAWSFSGYSASSATQATVNVTAPSSLGGTSGNLVVNLQNGSGLFPISAPVTVTNA